MQLLGRRAVQNRGLVGPPRTTVVPSDAARRRAGRGTHEDHVVVEGRVRCDGTDRDRGRRRCAGRGGGAEPPVDQRQLSATIASVVTVSVGRFAVSNGVPVEPGGPVGAGLGVASGDRPASGAVVIGAVVAPVTRTVWLTCLSRVMASLCGRSTYILRTGGGVPAAVAPLDADDAPAGIPPRSPLPLKSAMKAPGTPARHLDNPLSPTFREEEMLEKRELSTDAEQARDLVR